MDKIPLYRFMGCVDDLESANERLKIEGLHVSLEAYEKEIDEVFHAHQRVNDALNTTLALLRRRRNSNVKINQLPIEILCHIFHLAGHCGDLRSTNLAISSVCACWRSIALGDPFMWTFVNLENGPNYADIAVKRSEPLGLSVAAGYASAKDDLVSAVIEKNAHRLHALYLSKALPELNAPALKHLSMRCKVMGASVVLPTTYQLPNLQKVELRYFFFPWIPGMYKDLVCISIELLTLPGDPPRNASWDILVVFQESPHLENVYLRFHRKWQSLAVPEHQRTQREKTPMRNLRFISLCMAHDTALYLFLYLNMPNLQTLLITSDDIVRNSSLLPRLFTSRCPSGFLLHEYSRARTASFV